MTTYTSRAQPCLRLHVSLLRGRNITVGKWSDKLDTPDPYVLLRIPTAPSGKRKTKIVDNNPNPEWNETFEFYLDPDRKHVLHMTLAEADVFSDDIINRVTFNLGELKMDKTLSKTFDFGGKGEVDVEMRMEYCKESTDLRYSQELCDDENDFLKNRKQAVFEAMKDVLGDRAPRNLDEVPNVAVIGSGGGFRAMVGLTGAYAALIDTKIMDCATYTAGLSGSTWWMSVLYSHPDFPKVGLRKVIEELRENVKDNWVWLLVNAPWLYKRITDLTQKKRGGQPVSFTDFFGFLIGDTILKGRDPEPRLSEQRKKVKDGGLPLPIYTCIHVKKDVSAQTFCEWVEFTPYEVGMAKYGAFKDTKLFANKFFRGRLISDHPEPPLHYLQGIWGSAFTILLQRMLNEDQHPMATAEKTVIKGDGRAELKDMVDSDEIPRDVDEESSSEESDEYSDSEEKDEDGQLTDDDLDEHAHHEDKQSTLYYVLEKVKDVILLPVYIIHSGITYMFTREPQDLNKPPTLDEQDTVPEPPVKMPPPRKTSRLQSEMDKENYWAGVMKGMVGKFEVLKTRAGRAGLVHNYLRDLKLSLLTPSVDPFTGRSHDKELEEAEVRSTKSKRIFLVDSGLVFNSPFPALLRPQRGVDLYVSFDFSARDKDDDNPLTELDLAQQWAEENNLPFPPINAKETFEREGVKECYVFKHPTDPNCPVVVHFVLVNKAFKEFKSPGVKRETEEEKEYGDFSLFEDPDDPYSTFNFHYLNKPFDRLSNLMEFNTLLCGDVIKDRMAECVVKRRNNPR